MKPKTLSQIQGAILAALSSVYGTVERNVTFEVTPNIAQRIEDKKRQQFAFLQKITNTPTTESNEQIIALEDGSSVTQRTKKGDHRRPRGGGQFTDRKYQVKENEADVLILWDEMLSWGSKSEDVYLQYVNYITRARARDLLRIMWYGQKYDPTVSSNLTTYPLCQDIQKGVFQYMIENKPENVFGIENYNPSTGTYDINPIKVGDHADADFKNIAELTEFLLDEVISDLYSGSNSIEAITGRKLVSSRRRDFLAKGTSPTEASAAEILLKNDSLATLPITIPDEFPTTGLIISDPRNIENIYQVQSLKRKVGDDHELKAWVDYEYQRRDVVVKSIEGMAAVHPDAIQVKVDTTWVKLNPGTWKI